MNLTEEFAETLARMIQERLAQAWAEGFLTGWEGGQKDGRGLLALRPPNPYRDKEGE